MRRVSKMVRAKGAVGAVRDLPAMASLVDRKRRSKPARRFDVPKAPDAIITAKVVSFAKLCKARVKNSIVTSTLDVSSNKYRAKRLLYLVVSATTDSSATASDAGRNDVPAPI